MMSFKFLTFEELKRELDKFTFKQLHIHHTWKPTHRSFKGNNHIAMQQSMKDYHTKSLGWGNIGQHLTLFPDGKWLTGRPFNSTPASIKGWNTGALAVEMVGNFDNIGELPFNNLGYDELIGDQKKQILLLMKYFIDKYGEESIKFHRDNAAKSCPGTSLNKYAMINEAKELGKVKDKNKIKINLHGTELEVDGIFTNSTNYVPIRFLEKLGYDIGWENGVVIINYKGAE